MRLPVMRTAPAWSSVTAFGATSSTTAEIVLTAVVPAENAPLSPKLAAPPQPESQTICRFVPVA
jgi:hypothetical protein